VQSVHVKCLEFVATHLSQAERQLTATDKSGAGWSALGELVVEQQALAKKLNLFGRTPEVMCV